MTEYRVTWTIDVDADTPEDAALLARELQTDPDSTATIYNVTAKPTVVDLSRHDAGEGDDEPRAIHAACALCGADIEGWTDSDKWRDRGNSTECSTWERRGPDGLEIVTPPEGTKHKPNRLED